MVPDTQRYDIGNRSLIYFPDKGEEKVIGPQLISPTEEKEPNKAKIICLDFETYVRGKHIVTGEVEPTVSVDELPIPAVFDYEPYPFIHRHLDTNQYCYTQTINHCEAQYEESESTSDSG